ncbi:hypothetical protein [Mucilaginibacter phyllosphaerae]
MKKFYTAAYIALFCMATSSCTTRYYAPALYQNDIMYMIKPHSKDTVKTRIYASGNYLIQSGANGQGESNTGLLNIYRSHTLSHFNFSYGALAYNGRYKKQESDLHGPEVYKSYRGYGLNGSADIYTSGTKTDYRFGVDMAYNREGGDYLTFRRLIAGLPDVRSATQDYLLSYGIFTEFAIKANKNLNWGFKAFYNNTTGRRIRTDLLHSIGTSTTGGTFSIGYKRVTFHMTGAVGSFYSSGGAQYGLTYNF